MRKRLEEAIKEVLEELSSISEDEFDSLLKEHINGDVSHLVLEALSPEETTEILMDSGFSEEEIKEILSKKCDKD